jgi:hypothetical protein
MEKRSANTSVVEQPATKPVPKENICETTFRSSVVQAAKLALVGATLVALAARAPVLAQRAGGSPQDEVLRVTILRSMLQAASAARVSIQASSLVYATYPDRTMAFATVTGLEQFAPDQIASGAPVLFAYLSLPPEDQLPQGFYTIRIVDQGARAQFLNARGQVVAERRAAVLVTDGDIGEGESLRRHPRSIRCYLTKLVVQRCSVEIRIRCTDGQTVNYIAFLCP